jgi:hypothetical protein
MTECAICAAKRRGVPADPTLVAGLMPLCRPCWSQMEWRSQSEPLPAPNPMMVAALLGLP